MSKKKALVKDTEQIFDIESEYQVRYMPIDKFFPNEKDKGLFKIMFDNSSYSFNKGKKNQKEGIYYRLNGKSHHEDCLIVGEDNIREYKLNKIIK